MRFHLLSSMFLLIFVASACASIERMNLEHSKKVAAEFSRNKCNAEYFYEDGMNDAMSDLYMDTDDVTRFCNKKDFARFRASYAKGYKAGMKFLQKQGLASGVTGASYSAELPSCSIGSRRNIQCTDTNGELFQFSDSGCDVKCRDGKPVCTPAGCESDNYGRATGYGRSSLCSCQ